MLILKVFEPVHQRKITKKDGTDFAIRFQEAETVEKNRRPRVVEISIPSDSQYQEGLYTVSAKSFRPDKYERLEMAYPSLTPLNEAIKFAELAIKTK